MASIPQVSTTSAFVTNLSPQVSDKILADFFSFCGKITDIKLEKAGEGAEEKQSAVVTFETASEASTALLLTNAMLVDRAIHIVPYSADQPPPPVPLPISPDVPSSSSSSQNSAESKAKAAVTTVLADSYILGTEVASTTLNVAKQFEEKHHIIGSVKDAFDPLRKQASELNQQLHVTDTLSSSLRAATWTVKQVDDKLKIGEQSKQVAHATAQAAMQVANKALEIPGVGKGWGMLKSSWSALSSTATQLKQEAAVKVNEQRTKDAQVQSTATQHELHEREQVDPAPPPPEPLVPL
mmetsp:Transcript_4411/g.7719  ORF Transcript_4411/g.7719 Transcript_4411/m.7719 type:complete len:296 (-) Transcript_4411:503-1390(-)|eukprot:CAMPEP_0196667982 /NCGR_PEP_ID=MMETSP1086-20130531/65378_1 /TAXON_ID=77921 /ORGANISM="Cyanoptyche  gloeocystis , Strain SAG4.97" /LENGTH=295 /DNA_ID=CAMNT_0042005361 /DNA_START=40 /DNA_END=927 /DNA_ORIENTATION=-